MITKYSVVRYEPRPLSGEAINIGVIAWTERKIVTRFVDDWRRIRAFGRENIDFLREFAHKLEGSASSQQKLFGLEPESLNVHELETVVESWSRSISFSEPRASMKSPEEALHEVTSIYLLGSQHRPRARDRRTAAMIAIRSVSTVLAHLRGSEAVDLIKKQSSISGKIEKHIFDVVVENGRPYFAAQGLSFEKSGILEVQKDVDATAWAIDDVRKSPATRDLPVAVLALPPSGRFQPYMSARRIFRALDVRLISESGMRDWVKKTIRVLPPASSKMLKANS
jgi:hypothetical protein